MSSQRNAGALVGGSLLIIFGLLALAGQVFRGFNFWTTFWPLFVIGFGLLFFVGMLAGGRSVSGLAIPGTIVTTIGLMLVYQNITNHRPGKLVLWLDGHFDGCWAGYLYHGRLGTKPVPAGFGNAGAADPAGHVHHLRASSN